MMVGQTYYERGRPVTVLVAWIGPTRQEQLEAQIARGKRRQQTARIVFDSRKKNGPRNVVIEREDGSLVVRPFRGLRKAPPKKAEEA